MVSGSRWSASSIPVLQSALAGASAPEERRNLQRALCSALVRTGGWRQLASIAGELVRAYPQSASAFNYLATADIHLEDWSDLERIAQQRLQQIPDDLVAVRELARADFARGELQNGRERLKPLLDNSRVTAGDLNDYAWAALFTRDDESGAVEIAQRAVSMSGQKNYDILHTLACLYADTGREREARETLLQAMDAKHLLQPDEAIWFGLGRIADEYGERQAALDAYARVKPPGRLESKPISTWALAQERIRMLQVPGRTTASAR
jgi:tetratricopeptide (TPR) repeat protein